MEAEDAVDVEHNGLEGGTDQGAQERAVDGGQKQLLVDVEPVKNVDRSRKRKKIQK